VLLQRPQLVPWLLQQFLAQGLVGQVWQQRPHKGKQLGLLLGLLRLWKDCKGQAQG
jgi:hypothetical protein